MMPWVILALSLAMIGLADGLCMPEHVQTQFCNADFVVRVRVASGVKYEVPGLPPRPTSPLKPTLKPRNKPTKHNNNSSKFNKKPVQGVALIHRVKQPPAPFRYARSIVSGRRVYKPRPLMGWRYQEIKIKRILKGVESVENAEKTQVLLRANKTSRYTGRMYVSPSLHLKPGKTYILAGKIISNRLYVSRCSWYAAWNGLSLGQLRGLKKTFIQGCKCRVQFCYYAGCEYAKVKGACMWKPQGYYPVDDCRYHHSSCRIHKGKCRWIENDGYHKCMKKKEALMP